MKAIIYYILLALIPLGTFAQTKHLVIVSIDGLCPEMYQDKSWPSTNLQNLMKEGTYATYMISVFPAYTYPAHAAMLTGATPSKTGIAYNAPRGSKGDWNWFVKDIQTPTLWTALKQQHLTSAAVQWPISVSTDITWNVPEIWDPKHGEDRITQTRKYATPGLIEEIETHATGKLGANNMNEEHLSMDANSARAAAYIFSKYKPNFLALHFASVDGTGHSYGRNADSVRLALANADQGIGVMLEAIERSGIKDSTTILVVGDHGMTTMHSAIKPNLWIKGLKAKFQTAGGSCFLYLDNPSDQQILVKILERLKNLDPKYRKLFRIYDQEKLKTMGADKDAVLALVAKPGYVFSGSDSGEPLVKVKGGHHGYDPNDKGMHTGFIAAGAGIRKGGKIKTLNVTDIAPLIAKLLNIDFQSPDGKVNYDILIE